MRIAVSNIAWDTTEDEQVAILLAKYSIDAIDIAPGKYFPKPAQALKPSIKQVKHNWLARQVELTGMQSLLFGTTGLNLFGSPESQASMLAHLAEICRIAGILGSKRLVFGSPKNRDRSGLTNEQALLHAIPFFNQLGDIAQQHNVVICLEPNPVCYGANFMTTSVETLSVVKAINHPAIRMQLDTGAISINNENIAGLLDTAVPYIGHIHISEPGLGVVGDSDTDHKFYAEAILKTLGNDRLVSIEMVATKDEPHLESLERALAFVTKTYRDSL